MDKEKRKELQAAYKSRTVTGGIYYIQCSGNQRIWLRSTRDMEGAKNRFVFSQQMKGAPEPAMLQACNEYGWESFSFVVLEELSKESTQTDQAFSDDIAALLELWQEKYADGGLD